ncbi:hypothetical protein DQ239_15825 [Blastococcus sp. TF02-09]|uniref:hypothetical protein n=1 Tax=Blastococcus sp. TF02-09 TaxID=2250576 RepID=UPI000DEAB8EB|nr:hypothetical protein [Blastococcus sp. TF02-9]RBY75972.1 hypothetical protein DQ239_15825 [Blastococcus sp. TF02-9]
MSIDVDLDLAAVFSGAVRESAIDVPYGDGRLLTLPWALHNGECVAILVEPVADGLYRLSDRGLAADVLATANVDLGSPSLQGRWQTVQRSLALRPSVVPPPNAYELSGDATTDELGTALTTLAEAILRADGLQILGKPDRQLTFAERVVKDVYSAELPATPRAPLPNRFGGQRRVTCRIDPPRKPALFVQALASGDPNASYDHARALFADAQIDRQQLISVIQPHWGQAWHREALAAVSHVVDGDQWHAELRRLVA